MTAIHQLTRSKQKKKVSWATFEKKYLTREDGYRYEWLNGTIEKTKKMNKNQAFILRNLLSYFRKLIVKDLVTGELMPEMDLFFKKKHRRPDICWLTDDQIDNLTNESAEEIPTFVIEIISNNDVADKIAKKMNDYRAAKVKTVWHIYPNQQSVHIYTGKHLENIVIHTNDMVCSAAPGLENFEIKAIDIFAKKTK